MSLPVATDGRETVYETMRGPRMEKEALSFYK